MQVIQSIVSHYCFSGSGHSGDENGTSYFYEFVSYVLVTNSVFRRHDQFEILRILLIGKSRHYFLEVDEGSFCFLSEV